MKVIKNNNGFTLVEILITVLILSIGLLGLAGLQVSSMKSNHSSYLRSQATIMAYDMIDRMRANQKAVTDTDYVANTTYTVTAPTTTPPNPYYTVDGTAETGTCTTTGGCTTTQMAKTDITQWRVGLATQLPGGVGVICLDTSPDDGNTLAAPECSNSGTIYAIKIWWSDERDGTLKRFVTSYAP